MWLFKGFLWATAIVAVAFLLAQLSEVAILITVFLMLGAIFSWWMYIKKGG